MRLPLLISASSCQEAPVIHLFRGNWKFFSDNESAEFQVTTESGEDLEPINQKIGPYYAKVTKLTTTKPCSVYAELVRSSTGSS